MCVWMRTIFPLLRSRYEILKSLGWRTLNMINGYGRFLRQKKAGKASALHEGEAAVAFDENDDPFAEAPL